MNADITNASHLQCICTPYGQIIWALCGIHVQDIYIICTPYGSQLVYQPAFHLECTYGYSQRDSIWQAYGPYAYTKNMWTTVNLKAFIFGFCAIIICKFMWRNSYKLITAATTTVVR